MDYPLPEDEPTPMDEDDCEEGNSEDDMPNDLDNVNWVGYFELSDIAAGQTDAEPTPDATATTTNQMNAGFLSPDWRDESWLAPLPFLGFRSGAVLVRP